MLKCCRELRYLDVSGVRHDMVLAALFESAARYCPQLRALNMGCQKLRSAYSDTLLQLPAKCTLLRKVIVCDSLREKMVQDLLPLYPDMIITTETKDSTDWIADL